MPPASLQFPRNDTGEREGLADAGIETFKDTPYSSCAREAGQNSRDASEGVPVRLTFNVLRLSAQDVPWLPELKAALEACGQEATVEKEKDFFRNALKVVEADSVAVLAIADYNTKGLSGPPDKQGTPFHSLVKSAGISVKDSDTSGGSFGIGKNASFAVSDLQMACYATRYADETGKLIYAAQGKARLASHTDDRDVPRRATGYWGTAGFKAVTSEANAPAWMHRKEKGTTIYSVGFRESADWAEHMTAALVANFFCAVHAGDMVFDVGDKYSINANTLESLFGSLPIRKAAEDAGELLELEFAEQLYRCITSATATEKSMVVYGLGKMRVKILVEPGMPNRIGFIRNGMLITDNLRNFGHTFQKFPGSRDFIAVVQPEDEGARRLLKQLENPAHNQFSARRIPDPAKQAAALAAMKRLGSDLRALIKATTVPPSTDTEAIDELAQFFATQGQAAPPSSNGEDDPERLVYQPPSQRPPSATLLASAAPGNSGGGGTRRGSGSRGGNQVGSNRGPGKGGRGSTSQSAGVQLLDVRNTIPASKTFGVERVVYFTPSKDGSVSLTILATGIDVPEALALTATSEGKLVSGGVMLTVKEGVRTSIKIGLTNPYTGPIEVVATAMSDKS